jgi:crossover junction endodeoxyribonuclease RuvC
MIILGVDPGFAITGYGIIEYQNNRFKPIQFGVITTGAELDLPSRLAAIDEGLNALLIAISLMPCLLRSCFSIPISPQL